MREIQCGPTKLEYYLAKLEDRTVENETIDLVGKVGLFDPLKNIFIEITPYSS